MDVDGADNSAGDLQPAWNGLGFGDAIIDNERYGLSKSMHIHRNSSNSAITDPATAAHHVNFLNGRWKDGVPLTYGGVGYSVDPNSVPCDFTYPGGSDPVGAGFARR